MAVTEFSILQNLPSNNTFTQQHTYSFV